VPATVTFDFDAKAYAAAIAKAEAGDPGVDYLWLRKQAAAQSAYFEPPWADRKQADALINTQPEVALRMAHERMAVVWTDFIAHIIAEMALEKLGKHTEAERETTIIKAITTSIGGGHKGTSATDDFNAVTIGEEYRMLSILQWKVERQSLVNQGGHAFDVMDVDDVPTHQKLKVWFDIDAHFGKELGL